MNPKDKTRFLHMLEAIDEIASYVAERVQDRKTELAITRLVEIIGEAANNVSQALKVRHNDIPWRQIVNMRHVIVHEYFGIDGGRLWKVAKREVPELGKKLRKILKDKGN